MTTGQIQTALTDATYEQLQAEMYLLLQAEDQYQCDQSLNYYINASWPTIEPGREFIPGWHVEAICAHLEAVVAGDIKRLLINIPPRHQKSISCAVALPTWAWGPANQPGLQFMFMSYARDLAMRDSVKCRRLMQSDWYKQRWGDRFQFTGDQNLKTRFDNTKNGYRISTSVDGQLTGEGGDILVVDDPHNVREAESALVRQGVLDWYDQALQTRLNDPKTGRMIVIMQRVHENDLSGHILANELGDWDHLCLPARYEKSFPFQVKSSLGFKDPRTEEGELLWPDRFGEPELARLEKAMGSYAAAGQLQQRPSPKGGTILKAPWWREWPHYDQSGQPILPDFEWVLQSYDPAYSEADLILNSYSARTTWGVFKHQGRYNVMLLERWRDRLGFPALRKEAKASFKFWKPDTVIVEGKASGKSLIQELRQSNIPVVEYNPDRDKVARAHASSSLLEDGMVWYPRRKWAEDVIEMCAKFPAGDGADIVDTCTQAWIRLRRMWFMENSLEDFDPEDEIDSKPVKKKEPIYG